MPNLKIYIDRHLGDEQQDIIVKALPALRDMLSEGLNVDPGICQFSVIPVQGLPDTARVSVEMQLLPKAERTREQLLIVCEAWREALTGLVSVKTAVRATALYPANYIVLR